MEHLVLPLIEDDAERARMIDSIAKPDKMIQTPWHETPIPFQQAARLGTDKVIRDHSTL